MITVSGTVRLGFSESRYFRGVAHSLEAARRGEITGVEYLEPLPDYPIFTPFSEGVIMELKEICKKKPFYVVWDGEIRCAGCYESARYMTIKITDIAISLFITADGKMVDQEWDYGKVSLVCSCGAEIPENAYTWESCENDDWRLTIKKDAIDDRREGISCPDGRLAIL